MSTYLTSFTPNVNSWIYSPMGKCCIEIYVYFWKKYIFLIWSKYFFRVRRIEDEEASFGTICCFGFLFSVAQIFLHAALTLILFWICYFRWDQNAYPTPFLWRGEGEKMENQSPEERFRQTKEDLKMTWNLHPFLMVAGFIYFMGQAMLVYRHCE